MARNSSTGFKFMKKFEIFYPELHKDGKIRQPNKESFMVDYLGMDKNSWKNFRITGIRKIYYRLLELLEKSYPKC